MTASPDPAWRFWARALAAACLLATLASLVPPGDRVRARWMPVRLRAAAPAGPVAPGLVRGEDGVERGVLRLGASGLWALGIVSSGPARLRIGEVDVVVHPGADGPLLVARSVLLSDGDHPISVHATAPTTLVWQPPGRVLARLPAHALAHETGPPQASSVRDAAPPLAERILALPLKHPLELSAPVFTHWPHAALGTPAFPPMYSVRIEAQDASLELMPGEAHRLEALKRPLAPPDPERSRAPLFAVLAVLLLAVAGVPRGLPAPRRARALAVAALCALALALRLHSYEIVPHPLETEDEVIHHWSGWSITAGAPPLGWSDLPAYGPREPAFYWGHPLRVARPFLDWPPPMCALIGAAARAAGAKHPHDVPLHATRLVPILLATLAVWLTYLLARATVGGTCGPLLAAALYATMPLATGTARLVKADALLAVVALALLWRAARHAADGRRRSPLALAVLSALAVAVKQTGIAFALAALLGLARAGRRAAAAACALGIALGAASYPLWGCLWDKELHARVIAAMASTPLRLDNFPALLSGGSLVDRDFGGTFVLFLWIAFALPAPRAADPLKLAAAAYTALVALTTWFPFGWYRIPLFPLLAVPAGHALARLASHPRLPAAFLVAAAIVVPSFAYRSPLSDAANRHATGLALVALLAPIALGSFVRLPRFVPRAAAAALIALALALQAAVSLHLPYIDRGLVKERKPARVSIEGQAVRWR